MSGGEMVPVNAGSGMGSWFSGMYARARRWMYMIFNKNKAITDIIRTQVPDEHYLMLDMWRAVYSGFYEQWHNTKLKTISGERKQRMHTLNMAKVSTEELSKLVFTENVKIHISDEKHNERIDDVFTRNRFYKVFQNKVEQMLALGGLILKAHPFQNPDGTWDLGIKYVTPDCFVPISYEAEEITECVFITIIRKKDKIFALFEFHEWDMSSGQKVYKIRNELYQGNNEETDVKRVPLEMLFPDLEPEVLINNLTQPLFQYVKPNIANNFDLTSSLGIPIFANALDTLYAIDIAFDSFIREFRLGKRRIIVPASAIRTVIDPDSGQMHRYFDANDEVYQAFNFMDTEGQKVQDNTVPLRIDEHVAGINALLNLYAMQIGFSSGTFTFDGQGVKTATEVVSEQSKTYQTRQSLENVISEALEKFIFTLTEVGVLYDVWPDLKAMPEDYDIDFEWDETIIKDKYTEADYIIKLKTANLVSTKYALMELFEMTEEEALQMVAEIQAEQQASLPDISDLIAGGSDLNGTAQDVSITSANGTANGADGGAANADGGSAPLPNGNVIE